MYAFLERELPKLFDRWEVERPTARSGSGKQVAKATASEVAKASASEVAR